MKRFYPSMTQAAGIVLAGLVVVCLLAAPASAQSRCGDINEDGYINVGDAVYLVWHISNLLPVDDFDRFDINGDQAYNIGDAVSIINFVFRGGPMPGCAPHASGVLNDRCKIWPKSAAIFEECMKWEYDGEGTLSIIHTNSYLNCCFLYVSLAVDINDTAILIYENEVYDESGGCDCLCFYDLGYAIIDLDPGNYHIVVVDQHMPNTDYPLDFTIDLTDEPSSGEFCYSFEW